MSSAHQITPGMTINLGSKIYKVESCIKVSVPKGTPFIKAKLRSLIDDEIIEKNFKLNQAVQEVALVEHVLEFLYPEGKDYLFLDIGTLENVLVKPDILKDKINYLKEGIRINSLFYGDSVFSVDLPQFLELMVVRCESIEDKLTVSNSTKEALLETGAKIQVPLFVEIGDI